MTFHGYIPHCLEELAVSLDILRSISIASVHVGPSFSSPFRGPWSYAFLDSYKCHVNVITLLWCVFHCFSSNCNYNFSNCEGVCSAALTTTMTVTITPNAMGLAAALGQYDVNLQLPLILQDTMRGVVGLITVLQL